MIKMFHNPKSTDDKEFPRSFQLKRVERFCDYFISKLMVLFSDQYNNYHQESFYDNDDTLLFRFVSLISSLT